MSRFHGEAACLTKEEFEHSGGEEVRDTTGQAFENRTLRKGYWHRCAQTHSSAKPIKKKSSRTDYLNAESLGGVLNYFSSRTISKFLRLSKATSCRIKSCSKM